MDFSYCSSSTGNIRFAKKNRENWGIAVLRGQKNELSELAWEGEEGVGEFVGWV
jgi:hypothetical protein